MLRLGWTLESLAIEGSTPQGDGLTVDVGMSPRSINTPTLLLTSGLLNPKSPPSQNEFLLPRIVWYILRHGFKSLQAAVASGQYEYPKGLFYGGNEAGPLTLLLGERLSEWHVKSRRVLH